ncbi:hypothetical protein [Gallalistipes aquisgranensis]|uniref:hypothetical protein n=1 Tax=Gallalistipes aquisgranensis TaxID=2779358 RepID=UPI001CF8FCD2|nr:hypothetical protein [Gallalistipes aquisgranensis]MBE5034547.1 hypothetical protein [Gallalistipes aquisgranensis]
MKNLSIIQYILIAISVITVAMYFLGLGDVDPMLIWGYILLGIAVAAVIILPLFNLVKNPKGAVRSLVGLGIVVVLAAICYALSSDAPVVNSAGGFFEDSAVLKISDTGLYLTYIALAVAILAAIGGEIRNAFK